MDCSVWTASLKTRGVVLCRPPRHSRPSNRPVSTPPSNSRAQPLNQFSRDSANSPVLTRCAASSGIKVTGRPRKAFCCTTPGSVPARNPEMSCAQCAVATSGVSLREQDCSVFPERVWAGRHSVSVVPWRDVSEGGGRLDGGLTLRIPDRRDAVYDVQRDRLWRVCHCPLLVWWYGRYKGWSVAVLLTSSMVVRVEERWSRTSGGGWRCTRKNIR